MSYSVIDGLVIIIIIIITFCYKSQLNIPRYFLGTQMKQDIGGRESNDEAVNVQCTRVRHTVNLHKQTHDNHRGSQQEDQLLLR